MNSLPAHSAGRRSAAQIAKIIPVSMQMFPSHQLCAIVIIFSRWHGTSLPHNVNKIEQQNTVSLAVEIFPRHGHRGGLPALK